MLKINNLTIYDMKNRELIHDFTFSLGNSDKVAIIGEEGNRKSTLLKAIYNPDWIASYTHITGNISMDFKHLSYLHQKIDDCWNSCFIYEFLLKEGPDETIEIEKYNELSIYQELCSKVNLKPSFIEKNQTIHTLSGGEKVKLQLLKILKENPDLLLLDEPTNDLDIKTLFFLEDFILNMNIPIIFISHDETLLSKCANRIIHLEQVNKKSKCKHTIFNGNYDTYVSSRKNAREKEIQIANKEKEEYLKKQRKLNDMRNAVHDAQNSISRQDPKTAALLKKKMHSVKAIEKRFEREGYTHIDDIEEAIDVYFDEFHIHHKLVLHYENEQLKIGNRVLIENILLDVYSRDKIVICGDNGCGKSILMKHIYDAFTTKHIQVGYMPQNYSLCMNQEETPISFVSNSCDINEITRVRELLARMKFTREEMEYKISQLSEGQKAKLYLIRFIHLNYPILLLDEPTRNLSPLTNPVIRAILKDYKGCIISISHDRKYIEDVCPIKYNIENKKMILKEE